MLKAKPEECDFEEFHTLVERGTAEGAAVHTYKGENSEGED